MGWLKKKLGMEPERVVAFVEITDKNFNDEVVDSTLPVMLFVWSNSCPHCKRMVPNVRNIAGRYPNTIKAAHTSAELAPEALNMLEVMSVPTVLFIHKEEVVEQVTGFRPEEYLEQVISTKFAIRD